jgi:uncharacterized protein (TIGR02231 family)
MNKKSISRVFLILFLFACLWTGGIAEEKQLSSAITAVSVFVDRAQVTRIGSIRLNKGEHKLLVEGLPRQLDKHSINVTGTGPAVLKDIQFTTRHQEEIADPQVKKLTDQLEELKDSVKVLQDYINHSVAEKQFLDKIVGKLTSVPEKNQEPMELDPEKWIKMVEFYRSKLGSLSTEQRDYQEQIEQLHKSINKINRELSDLNSRQARSLNAVSVAVNMKKAGKLKLKLTYMVYNVSWQPGYDIRVSTETKKLGLTYNAIIRQNTSEDWNKVALSLSTARPAVSGDQPELQPWFIDFYRPQPVYKPKARRSAAPSQMMNVYKAEPSMEKMAAKDDLLAEAPPPPMAIQAATVSTGATAMVYKVPGKSSVKSDNQEHKVAISQHEFPAYFRYSAVPKLSPHAYLKAKVVNSSEFTFLEGKSNIFLDENFVSNSRLELIAPQEEFWTFLGIDEGIVIERKLIKKYQSKKGVLAKQTHTVYEYKTEITSRKKHEEELVLWDQIPISNNKEIKVKLTKPEIKSGDGRVKINDQKYIEWLFKLKPGQKVEVPFVFTVAYPKGKQISGM